ncbi:AI-2E family transporter [Nonomuraea sp. NPDC003804]|uniref:AI-2E family transporter n=1 Tax=Nonomuraea sp. NPDC003804 TaxID=3154547 RepID=UPI0033A63180
MTRPSEPRGIKPPVVKVLLAPANVWRVALVVAAVVALMFFLRFLLTDAGWLLVLLVMAWFTSLAMEPAVRPLSRRMSRRRATLLVMVTFTVVAVIFLILFGNLFVQQVGQLLLALPDVAAAVLKWINARLGTQYKLADLLKSLNVTPQQAAAYAQDVVGGVLGLVGTVAGMVFKLFMLVLLTYYFSADGPRLRQWVAQLLPSRYQLVFIRVWELSTEKTGGYVSARLILATINGGTSALVFLAIGMPSWFALGVWTGAVAQFVPTIGTYISIALPTVVGLASPRPWVGVAALAWAVVYQQVENLTLEPRISARSVDIHPGVSFTGVTLGAALFGAVGALLAIPVAAMLVSLVDTYATRYELVAADDGTTPPVAAPAAPRTVEPPPP